MMTDQKDSCCDRVWSESEMAAGSSTCSKTSSDEDLRVGSANAYFKYMYKMFQSKLQNQDNTFNVNSDGGGEWEGVQKHQ